MILALAVLVTFYNVYEQDIRRTTIVSETGCCSVSTYQSTDTKYLVSWTDNTMIDSQYTQVVDIYNPIELQWVIAELQDLCWTQHGHRVQDN